MIYKLVLIRGYTEAYHQLSEDAREDLWRNWGSYTNERSPQWLADFVKNEVKKWEAPIKASGVQVE